MHRWERESVREHMHAHTHLCRESPLSQQGAFGFCMLQSIQIKEWRDKQTVYGGYAHL